MCKVASVAGVTDKNRDQVWLFMMSLGEVMSYGNSDGLGYAAFDKQNNIFGERWLLNHTAFSDFSELPGMTAKRAQEIYNYFGDQVKRDEAKAIILHTRMATCSRGLKNTHPFVDDLDNPKTALIHNGIIYNDTDFKKKYSTCDSEVIVHNYAENNVNSNLYKLSDFTKNLDGWYTCAVLAKDKNGQPIIDLFTDSPRLKSYYIPEMQVRVFSTNGEDIKRVARKYGYSAVDPLDLDAETAIRLNANTGNIIEKASFVARDWAPANVYSLTGNFDDADFWSNWLKRGGDV